MKIKLMLATLLMVSQFTLADTTPEKPWGVYLKVDNTKEVVSGDVSSETKIFIPIKKTTNGLTFIDLRTFKRDDIVNNFNIGFGHREVINENLVGGIVLSAGITTTDSGEVYDQRSIGIELLTKEVDFTANYYFSLGDDERNLYHNDSYIAQLDGDGGADFHHTVVDLDERRLNGFDVNLDYRIPYAVNGYEFEAGASYYKYDGVSEFEGQNGYFLNIKTQKEFDLFGSTFQANLEFGRNEDSKNGGKNYVKAGVNYEFGQKAGTERIGYDNDLYSMNKRRSDIVTSTVDSVGTYTTPGQFHVEQNVHDQYTMVDANEDAATVIENAGAGSLIVLTGEEGDFLIDRLASANVNQSFVGGSTVLKVTGPNGEEAYLALPGSKARVVYTPGSDIVRDSSNATGENIEEIYINPEEKYGDNLVMNESFENCHGLGSRGWGVYETLCGWNVDRDYSDAPIEIQNGIVVTSQDGTAHLELDSHNRNGFTESNADVYQDLETKKGKVYRMTYYYQARVVGNSSTNGATVQWEGNTVSTMNDSSRGWQKVQVYVRANADGSRIDFMGSGTEDTYGALIDMVTVEEI